MTRHSSPKRLPAVLTVVGLMLLAFALAAPELGLGKATDFVLYRMASISRTGLVWIAILVLLTAIWRAAAVLVGSVRITNRGIGFAARVIPRSGRWLKVVTEYYALPPVRLAATPPRRDQTLILAVALVCQIIFLFVTRLTFECDASIYWQAARAVFGLDGHASYYRPPLFPAYLGLTGLIWVHSFIPYIVAHPVLGFMMLAEGFTLIGFNLNAVPNVRDQSWIPSAWPELFSIWGVYRSIDNDYDAGGCASAYLPKRMMEEYAAIYQIGHRALTDAVVERTSLVRNTLRLIAGLTLVFGWWTAFLFERRWLYLSLIAPLSLTIILVGISAQGAYTRTEYTVFPCIIIVTVCLWTEIFRLFRSRRLPTAARTSLAAH